MFQPISGVTKDQLCLERVKCESARQVFRPILENPALFQLQTLREQIRFVCSLTAELEGRDTRVAELFNIPNVASVQNHLKNASKASKPYGRPSVLTVDERDEVVNFIRTSFLSNHPATVGEVADMIEERFDKRLDLETVRNAVKSTKMFKSAKATPMEAPRAQLQATVVEQYFRGLSDLLKGKHPSLVFNVDESGISPKQAAKTIKVLIPVDAPSGDVHYQFNRQVKRITIVGTVALDGTALKPFMITSRKTVPLALYEFGWSHRKCCISFQKNAYIDSSLFVKWAEMVLVPAVHERRKAIFDSGMTSFCQLLNHLHVLTINPGYLGCTDAVLILDGCEQHKSDEFRLVGAAEGIAVMFLPAHSSHLLQPLDLSVFAQLKRKYSREIKPSAPEAGGDLFLKNVLCSLRAFESAVSTSSIIAGFNRVGLFCGADHNGCEFVEFRPCEAKAAIEQLGPMNFQGMEIPSPVRTRATFRAVGSSNQVNRDVGTVGPAPPPANQ